MPNCLIIRTAGTNCDVELAHAFTLAGATVRVEHVNALIEDPTALHEADLIGLPGGFSYGDDIAAGRILANRLRHRLEAPFRDAVSRGVPIIGVCNGFQVLIKMGLLPQGAATESQTGTESESEGGATQAATLTNNDHGRFVDRWVPVNTPTSTRCIWTQGLDRFELPIAHGEGKFVASEAVVDRLENNGQIALVYGQNDAGQTDNPNGSHRNIAGICDPSGLIFGLMPHPERYTDPTHHPLWTRQSHDQLAAVGAEGTPGLRIFRNAVAYAETQAATASV